MKNRARIFLVCFILVGGTGLFAFRSLNQLNNALDDISATNLAMADASPNSFFNTTNNEPAPAAAPEVSGATSVNLEPSFIFPQQDDELYMGCTYQILVQLPAAVSSLDTALVDAGSRDTVGAATSGLAKKNTIDPNSKSFNWKIGVFFHGDYYIKATAQGAAFRSGTIALKWMPRDASDAEKTQLCKDSGGSF